MISEELINILQKVTPEEDRILKGNDVDLNLYTDSQTKVIDANKLLENGKLIQIRPHTRFVHFPEHTHNYVEIIYMCKGSTIHYVNSEEIVLNQGELLFLNQNSRQEIMPAGVEDVAVNFIVLPQFFDRALEMLGVEENPIRTFIIDCMSGKDAKTNYLHFKVADVLPVQNLIENLVWSLISKEPGKRSINQITMGLLILQLVNMADRIDVGEKNYESEVMLKVYRYIDDNYQHGDLKDLSDNLGMKDFALSRLIKKSAGKNYTDLLQEKRLSQAGYLLKSTSMNIDDIGAFVGYDNTSYFYRLFKERMGMSPREYRIKAQTPS